MSPIETPARGTPSRLVLGAERHLPPEQHGEAFRRGRRVIDDGSGERHLLDVQQRIGRCRWQSATEVRIEWLFGAEPLDHDAGSIGGVGEHDVTIDARGDAHPVVSEELDRGVNVRDLHGDRAHVGSETLHEAIDGTSCNDRLADLDDVVAEPGHAAPTSDRRVLDATVLEHPQSGDPDQCIPCALIVRDHRRGVEAPPNLVPASHAALTS